MYINNIDKRFIEEKLINSIGAINSRALKKYDITNEEVYLIYHDLEKPYCEECGEPLKYKSFQIGYLINSCNNSCPGTIKRREQTVLKNHGVLNGFQTDKSKEKILERYGVDNPFLSSDVQKICSEKMSKTKNSIEWKETTGKLSAQKCSNTKNSIEWKETVGAKIKEKMRSTNESNGKWIPLDNKTEFQLYKREVWAETNNQNLEQLENYDKRGRIDLDPNAYSLDHKFSIYEGFKQRISPKIIGNIKNLIMLPWHENRDKGRECSITLEEII